MRSSGFSHFRMNAWLHRFTFLTALATLALIGIGGLVTSHGVGMAVPDWPTSFGYNMFFFPVSKWVGGIRYEHSHRLLASVVGVLVVGLTRWLGGRRSRLPLAIVGLIEVLAGLALLRLGPDWQGAGHFLGGIGAIVLFASAIWARNEPAATPLPQLGWLAFVLVQVQGLLGGLRVVLLKDELGIFHATLAQLFFVLLCAIALFTSRWWQGERSRVEGRGPNDGIRSMGGPWFALVGTTTLLIFVQLILGATMRHQHAGLAIPDFPLAYGQVWPAMDAQSVERYNQHRMEITAVNPITSFQIGLQMAHRMVAVLILVMVAVCAWLSGCRLGWAETFSRLGLAWVALILCQAFLGAATVWSNKAADLATAHVLVGALSLAMGALMTILASRGLVLARRSGVASERAEALPQTSFEPRRPAAASLE